MKILHTLLFFFTLTINSFSQGLPLPYYSGFDSPVERAGWQQFRKGVLSLYDWGNVGSLYHDYNVGASLNDTVIDWFVSPPLNLISAGMVSMKVQTSGFSQPTSDNCEVYFGTGNPDPAIGNFVLIGNLSFMQPQFQWIDTSFNISTLSDSGYLAFKYKTIYAAWMTYNIDSITISQSVGIDEKNKKKNFIASFSPNPFSTFATIKFNSYLVDVDITVFNLHGQKVKIFNNFNGSQLKLGRENLKNGIYFIQLSKKNVVIETEKVIISD